ncbi:MAG: DNA-processing protein DprA [Planctomycetota bacterium]
MTEQARKMAPDELLGPLDEVEQKHSPELVYVAGDTTLITSGARVAIVGSRKASDLGLRRARKLARMLVANDVVVVSGLAEGIDTAAHVAAIEAGGRTVAVLGTPLEKAYPAANRELQNRIMAEHLAISQFAPGSSWDQRSFPMRNRTMALFSDATVIVEAGPKSGTIHQGWEAIRLGRSLYVLDSLAREGHPWLKEMLGYGAQVLSDANAQHFLEDLPEESRVERIATSF